MNYFTTTASSSTKQKKNKQPKNHPNPNPNRPSGPVRLSTDPQSVAARERRHRISDRFKILQSLVPGGSKMDTVSMLEQAINYVKFLKTQIMIHETLMNQQQQQASNNNYSEDETTSFLFTDPDVMLPDLGNYSSNPGGGSGLLYEAAGGCASQLMMYPPPECFLDDGYKY